MDLPEFLVSGQRVRLFPVLADTSREGRTLSIFLACLCAVDEFGKALLASIGHRLGTRSRLEAFTEVVFKSGPDQKKVRPDGLVIVNTGKRRWSALVEAKIGKNEITHNQIDLYAQLAKANGIDAIITLSNQFVALPEHHPVPLPKVLARSLSLYHWSWMFIVTQASLLIDDEEIKDKDQQYILSEFVRFIRHPSVGVASFDRMNSAWKDVVAKIQAGGVLARNSSDVENTVASWHQETIDICLIMSRKLGREVKVRLSRARARDPIQRLRDDCDALVQTARLECVFDVPDAAAPICVVADLRTRSVTTAMKVAAPTDRKSTKARINWLSRQLAKSDSKDVYVKAFWPGRANATMVSLTDLRSQPELLEATNKTMTASSFEVLLVRDLGARFSGTRTFIEGLEHVVPTFYEQVGQHLRAWVPPAPKLKEETADDEIIAETTAVPSEQALPIN